MGSVNFSHFQSAYVNGHSTETALLEVLDNRVYTAANDKPVTVLVDLDLSAIERLQSEFGVTGTPLAWLQPYL